MVVAKCKADRVNSLRPKQAVLFFGDIEGMRQVAQCATSEVRSTQSFHNFSSKSNAVLRVWKLLKNKRKCWTHRR